MGKIHLLDGYGAAGFQGLVLPAWPRDMPRQAAWTSVNGVALDAAGEYFDWVGQIAGPRFSGTKTIDAIIWRSGLSSAAGHTLRISIQDRDTTVVPVRGDGTDDQYADVATPAASTQFTTTLSSGTPKVVSWGDWIVVRFALSAITSGQFNVPGMSGIANPGYHEHLHVVNTGTPATTHFIGTFCIQFTDTSLAILNLCMPRLTGAQTEAFNSSTAGSGLATGARRALRWTPAQTYYCVGGQMFGYPAAGANFEINLYEGTTEIASTEWDADHVQSQSAIRWIPFMFADEVRLLAGRTYYLAMVPTTTNNVTVNSIDASARNHLDCFAPNFSYDCWGSSDWQNPTNSDLRMLMASFRLSGIEFPESRRRPAILRGR
jgi:hypothetical protein